MRHSRKIENGKTSIIFGQSIWNFVKITISCVLDVAWKSASLHQNCGVYTIFNFWECLIFFDPDFFLQGFTVLYFHQSSLAFIFGICRITTTNITLLESVGRATPTPDVQLGNHIIPVNVILLIKSKQKEASLIEKHRPFANVKMLRTSTLPTLSLSCCLKVSLLMFNGWMFIWNVKWNIYSYARLKWRSK